LESIIRQKGKSYIIEKIYVISDGSTDNTLSLVKEFSKKFPNVHIIGSNSRIGKMKRLMELYKLNTSSYVLTFDADVVLETDNVIESLICSFNHPDVAIASGNRRVSKKLNFFQKIIKAQFETWTESIINFKDGNNPWNSHGSILCLTKEFSKHIIYPNGLLTESQFLYFTAIKENKKFKFVKQATIIYNLSNNIGDFLLQHQRSVPYNVSEEFIFGKWVNEHYAVDKKTRIKATIKVFLKNPFYTILGKLFIISFRFIPQKRDIVLKPGIWTIASSSKKGIIS
jgi:glycosyltransferase involved in cell wall biosynthesis